jgi:hypothetical protein
MTYQATTLDRRSLLSGVVAASFAGSWSSRAKGAVLFEGLKPEFDGAVISGLPLYELARTAWTNVSPRPGFPEGRFNLVTQRRVLSTPVNREVTAPNNDTLYVSVRIDLSTGPVLIDIPDIPDRYFSVQFMDAFTDTFHAIGTRATGGRGGRLRLVPAGVTVVDRSDIPTVVSPTLDVWMLARILIDGPDDLPVVNALQDQFQVTPSGRRPVNEWLPTIPMLNPDPQMFLAVCSALLTRCQADDLRVIRALRYSSVGLERSLTGGWDRLSPEIQAAWPEQLRLALAALTTAENGLQAVINGWSYSSPETGRAGANDRMRAAIALGGLAALPPEEANYMLAVSDAAGAALMGDRRYRLRLPPGGVPVDAFWSLTSYSREPDGRRFLVENPIGRYSIGDRTRGLVLEPDGSLVIHLSATAPEAGARANWLPIAPGPFQVSFRAYLPRDEIRQGRWRLPALERLDRPL